MPTQAEILRAIWLAAHATGEKRIFYDTKTDAKRMQMHLYGVYKPLRRDPHCDPDLFAAYNACEISIIKTDQFVKPYCLIVRHKAEDKLNSVIRDALGQLDLTLPDEPEPVAPTPVPEPESDLDSEGDDFLRNLEKGDSE